MSYNNYGNYSPYFPSQPSDPNDRSQYSYQNASGGASNNLPHGEYQRQAYVAPNAALSSQQSQPHPNSNGAYANTMRYSNLEGTASASHQNQRNDYGYGNARTPGDTTALGNLAYASTLRQSSGPQQRPADYSRQAQNGGYDQSQSQVDERGIQRSDSRGSSNINSSYTSAPSYSSYSATSGQPNQEFSMYGGNYRSYQPAHQHAQPARQEASEARRADQNTVPAPPSRPASGQSTHASRPHSSQQSNKRSRTAIHTPVQQSSGSRSKPAQAVSWKSHQPSASSDEVQLSRQLNTQQTRPGAVITAPPSRASARSPADHVRASSNASTNEQLASRPQSAQLPPIQNVPATQPEPRTNAGQYQHPTTVDPNQVFNHYEYEKRQAEAEASKRKAAAEAEEAKRKAQAAKQAQHTALPNSNVNGVSANGIDEEARKKEQMETEMKLMLEKMREYKSKDPTLFSQIWESVKKAQPPGGKDTTQASELPASKEVALPSPQVPPSNLQSPQDPQSPQDLQSPSTPAGPSNASEALQPPQNEELPDRGKFPAARRKRYEKKSRGGRVSAAHGETDGEQVAAAHGQTEMKSVTHIPNVASNISKVDAAITPNSRSHPETEHTPNPATSTQPAQQVSISGKKAGSKKARSTPSKKGLIPEGAMSFSESSIAGFSRSPAPIPVSAVPTASGQTVWPEADKWTLANAARDTLLANPRNAGKLITNTEVHNILSQGPSYEELCRILEVKGFVVERTPFAQHLLAAVPKLKESHPRQPATSPRPPPSQPLQPLQPPQSLQPTQPPQALTNGSRNVAPMAPMFGVLQPTQASQTSHRTPKGEVRSAMQRPVRPPPPPSKQEQARKRTFGEIVDITAEMSSDEELKRQRAEELKKIAEIKHMQEVKAAMEAAMTEANTNAVRSKAIRLSPGTGLSASEDDAVSRLSRFRNPTPQREHLRRSREVVRSMNARADALRRSVYDSKTIARDILVAAGKHPTMASLNYHLDPLRSSFRHVEVNSDLSTFNWDLIDPGGPPVKPRKVETPVAQQNENEDADDEEVDDSARRSQLTHNRQSGLSVTNVDDNVEDVIMLDTAPSEPIKGFFQPGRGRGRGRGRGPQPSRGHSRVSLGRPPRQPDYNNPPAQTAHSTDVSMLGPGVTTNGAFEPRVLPSTPTPASMTPTNIQLSTGESGKKRRGRPPKNREPSPQNSIPSRSRSNASKAPESAVNKSGSRTVPAGMPKSLLTPRIVGSANAQRPIASTTPARPSGLRNQTNTSPFAVVIQRSPSNIESISSHEPAKKLKKVRMSPAPPPKYQIYRCRWKNCEGQLHNLETLRKHVHSHMSQFDETFECLWEGCGMTKVTGTSGSERQSLTFKSETAWERHMDGRHLDKYAWELGDGPSPHPSDAEASDCLSDSQKRRVTPIASPDNPRFDSFNLATIPHDERAKVARAYHTAHENKTEAQKAQAVFDNLLERRRNLGPGIERGGHTFVTDAKRNMLDTELDGLRKVNEEDI